MKLLITDLDNTLYDWATYFSLSFNAMAKDLSQLLNVDIEHVLDDFKSIHQYYGNTEQPFAILELPCVKNHFGELSREELVNKLNGPLHKFNSQRKKILRLYEGVEETLRNLDREGVIIVGLTEAMAENAYFRLNKLNISQYFKHLYTIEGRYIGHPIKERQRELSFPEGLIRVVSKTKRKPNPQLLIDICNAEKVSRQTTWYIGDSLPKDIYMANAAGVKSIWARYGTKVAPHHWNTLVRVTHWTDEDVKRESELKKKSDNIKPDFIIDKFPEIISLLYT